MGLKAQGRTEEERGIHLQENTNKVKVFGCDMLVKTAISS